MARRIRNAPMPDSILAPALAELADLTVVGGLIQKCCLTLPDLVSARNISYLAAQVVGHAEAGVAALLSRASPDTARARARPSPQKRPGRAH